jgi:hypothetical protein
MHNEGRILLAEKSGDRMFGTVRQTDKLLLETLSVSPLARFATNA